MKALNGQVSGVVTDARVLPQWRSSSMRAVRWGSSMWVVEELVGMATRWSGGTAA